MPLKYYTEYILMEDANTNLRPHENIKIALKRDFKVLFQDTIDMQIK